MADVVKLVDTESKARKLIVEFLREWADDIEIGKENAEKAVLILYGTVPGDDLMRIRSRRCCVDNALEHVGLMQMALHDVSANN
jgi:hypothetical protein